MVRVNEWKRIHDDLVSIRYSAHLYLSEGDLSCLMQHDSDMSNEAVQSGELNWCDDFDLQCDGLRQV